MNNILKIIKYYRKDKMSSYLFSLFNELTKTELDNSIIYTKNNQYIVFALDKENETLYFSNKYVWKELISFYKLRYNKDIINVVKEIIDLLYPEYTDNKIHYSSINSDLQQFIKKNKLNKIYLENENYNKLRVIYVHTDYTFKHKYTNGITIFNKNEIIYFNGISWFKMGKDYKNILIYTYFPSINNNSKELDLNNKEDIKIFNRIKPHLIRNKYNTNYYFQ